MSTVRQDCRHSFEGGCYSKREGGTSPPTKVRRASLPQVTSSPTSTSCSDSTVTKSPIHGRKCRSDPIYNIFGFSPNEFLPFDYHISSPLRLPTPASTRILNKMADDALGNCLWSGFLDTFEMVKVSVVSKRFCKMASKQILSLDLSRCRHLKVDDIKTIVRRFPNLKSLNLSYCTQFKREHLLALVPLARSLESLCLKGASVCDDDIRTFLTELSIRCHGTTVLSNLDLSAVEPQNSCLIGNESLREISTYCPNLRSLKVAWCKNVDDACMAYLSNLPYLELLDLSLTGITDCCIPMLRDILFETNQSLSHLNLSATSLSGEALLEAMGTPPSIGLYKKTLALEELVLQFIDGLTRQGLKKLLNNTPYLRLIDLTHASFHDGSNPQAIAKSINEYLA